MTKCTRTKVIVGHLVFLDIIFDFVATVFRKFGAIRTQYFVSICLLRDFNFYVITATRFGHPTYGKASKESEKKRSRHFR